MRDLELASITSYGFSALAPRATRGSSACVVGGNIEEALAIVNVKEGAQNPYSDNHGMEKVTGSSSKRSRSLGDCLVKELYGSRTWAS